MNSRSTAPSASAARPLRRAAARACALVAGVALAGSAGAVTTRATPLDDRGAQLICSSGGDLHFEIGGRRVRIATERWAVSARIADGFEDLRGRTLEACGAAPLRVFELRLRGPAGLPLDEQRYIALLDTRSQQMRGLRSDFGPSEVNCRRGAHWTWCGPAPLVEQALPTDPWVNLRFDPDFYRAPDGAPFFLIGMGGYPTIGNFGPVAFYRWDAALAVAYPARGCRSLGSGRPADCNPLHYVESDRELRRTVQELLASGAPRPRAEPRQHPRKP